MDVENIGHDCLIEIPQEDAFSDYIDPDDVFNASMEHCQLKDQPIVIYISELLEKLTNEMKFVKYYDTEEGQYRLSINPPIWFNSIDNKYKKILYKLIEPVLENILKR